MDDKYIKTRIRIIKETFEDTREIKHYLPTADLQLDENIRQEGDFFLTEDGEFVVLEVQLEDFMEEDLVEFVELAENIYEKYKRTVSIYIICPNEIDVCVKEFEISSDASFTIKLAKTQNDFCKTILNSIKEKIKNGEPLDKEDMNALNILPKMCKKEERYDYMLECFKIKNQLN